MNSLAACFKIILFSAVWKSSFIPALLNSNWCISLSFGGKAFCPVAYAKRVVLFFVMFIFIGNPISEYFTTQRSKASALNAIFLKVGVVNGPL